MCRKDGPLQLALMKCKMTRNIIERGMLVRFWTVCGVLLLPVNDDWIRGRLVSIATTFLLTAATDLVETRKQKRGKSVFVR